MKNKPAPGIDGISVKLLRRIHDCNHSLLKWIFDSCLHFGIFPSQWKVAKVIPILKGPLQNPELTSSYRPICLLPVMGKLLDKLITRRLSWWIQSHGGLSPLQYEF